MLSITVFQYAMYTALYQGMLKCWIIVLECRPMPRGVAVDEMLRGVARCAQCRHPAGVQLEY